MNYFISSYNFNNIIYFTWSLIESTVLKYRIKSLKHTKYLISKNPLKAHLYYDQIQAKLVGFNNSKKYILHLKT